MILGTGSTDGRDGEASRLACRAMHAAMLTSWSLLPSAPGPVFFLAPIVKTFSLACAPELVEVHGLSLRLVNRRREPRPVNSERGVVRGFVLWGVRRAAVSHESLDGQPLAFLGDLQDLELLGRQMLLDRLLRN